jgi:nitrite reductase (NADH) small subunit
MMAHRWVRVTHADNIPIREGRAVTLGGRQIAIFNLGDCYLATDNRCPHRGGPLCDGIVTGHSVVCPLHAWKVDLETGSVERPTGTGTQAIGTYPTRVDHGVVVVGVPEGSDYSDSVEEVIDAASCASMTGGLSEASLPSSKNDSRPHFQGS